MLWLARTDWGEGIRIGLPSWDYFIDMNENLVNASRCRVFPHYEASEALAYQVDSYPRHICVSCWFPDGDSSQTRKSAVPSKRLSFQTHLLKWVLDILLVHALPDTFASSAPRSLQHDWISNRVARFQCLLHTENASLQIAGIFKTDGPAKRRNRKITFS